MNRIITDNIINKCFERYQLYERSDNDIRQIP